MKQQMTIWDLLGLTPNQAPPAPGPLPFDAALPMRDPTLDERAHVLAAIREIVPPGAPSYVADVHGLNRAPRSERYIADVVMFDGRIGRVEICGSREDRTYEWHRGDDFRWDI